VTHVLFWDIDGTLLTTQRAGVIALQDACRETVGREVDLDGMETRGITDTEIAARILARCGHSDDDAAIARFMAVYERQLPLRLPLRKGGALPGVVLVLERLRERDDVLSVLLTGNTAAGAAAKLKHYGLQDYFTLGAYADGVRDRLRIAEAAVAVAEGARGAPVAPDQLFVIGDTPHDALCARHIGARALLVATGGYSIAELQAVEPWRAVHQLPAPEDFEHLLGLTSAGPTCPLDR
jgi:phosphoglycolate phosphatase-like HAD superfamily hydrolase